eukprot:762444-Hanusia_phi.AAC.5
MSVRKETPAAMEARMPYGKNSNQTGGTKPNRSKLSERHVTGMARRKYAGIAGHKAERGRKEGYSSMQVAGPLGRHPTERPHADGTLQVLLQDKLDHSHQTLEDKQQRQYDEHANEWGRYKPDRTAD